MDWQTLVQTGVIGQAILATGLMAGILWQVTHQQTIDPILAGFLGTVIGYFFRTVQNASSREGST